MRHDSLNLGQLIGLRDTSCILYSRMRREHDALVCPGVQLSVVEGVAQVEASIRLSLIKAPFIMGVENALLSVCFVDT